MFGEALRSARDAVGLTQEAAARKIGVTSEAVSRWERNIWAPSLEHLRRAEEVYETTFKFGAGGDVERRLRALEEQVAELLNANRRRAD